MTAASLLPNTYGMSIELRPGRLGPRSLGVLRNRRVQRSLLAFLGKNLRAYHRFKRGVSTSRILADHPGLRGVRSRGGYVTVALRKTLIGCRGSAGNGLDLPSELRTNAINAAFHDFRRPLRLRGLGLSLNIHVVIFTEIQEVTLRGPKDVARNLKPGRIAYALYGHAIRATLLPAVVRQCPSADAVFRRLLEKSGWREPELDQIRFPLRLCRAQTIEFGGRVNTSR